MRIAAPLLLAVLVPAALAQGPITGSVQGTVRDSDGAALPGVSVTAASDVLVSRKLTAVTDSRGVYRFPALPPGTYVIEGELSGFRKATRPDVKVRVGATLSVDLDMALEKLATEIVVTAEAPVVSVVSNSVSTSFDQDYLVKQPIPRNFYSIISTAPGVNADYTGSSGSAMLAYGGTTESQNAFTLDGVNVADAASGQHWILPSIQWMQEIQVGGLGANAEFGGYTGGVINGVTKSGGNEFHGGFEFYYQPESWTSNNQPEGEDAPQTFKFQDASISIGGPIAKDNLWFFASAEYWRQETTPLGAVDTSDRKIPRFLGKLTWQINDKNRLMLMGEYDAVTNERRGISDVVLPEASSKQDGPGGSFAIHWESLFGPSDFANVKVTGYDGRDDYLPYHGTDLSGRIDDSNTGIAWVNQDIQELNHRHIVTGDVSWTHFQDGLFSKKDGHTFKVGALYEKASSNDLWLRNGGYTYYDDSSTCDSWEAYQANPACGAYYIERGYGEYHEWPKYSGLHFFAQDSMQLDRVTVNLGLRYGSYKGGWQEGHGTSTVYDVDFWDPRIGFAWDVTGKGKTAVKAHWGRYHDKAYTYMWDREASGNAAVPDQDCYFDSDTGGYTECDEPTYISATMGKVDHPYVDETLLTFEHQLGKEMAIGVDGIDRRFRNIIGMVNTNDDYTLIEATGNPLTGGTLPIYNLNSPPNFVLTTDNGAYRDFQSVVVRFDKRFAKGWQLRTSVVWTDIQGNVLKNNGYAPELRDKNGLTNADGRMEYAYSKWEYKLSGAVNLPLNFTFSGQYTYLSGWYWTPYVRVSGLDYNSSIGRDIYLTDRGSEKFPGRNLVDLRLAWTGSLGPVNLTASVEGFNILNQSTVLDVYNRWGSYSLSRKTWTQRGNYSTAYQIENPRQIRAGIRVEF